MIANLIVPSIVEMNDVASEQFPNQEEAVANMVASVNATTLGVRCLIGPIYGSTMEQYIGFKLTMDATVCIDLVFAMAYLICAGGVQSFKRTYQNFRSEPSNS